MGGTTTGGIRIILRLEGLGVLILALAANSIWGIDWRYFTLFFFAPDLSKLGYFAGHESVQSPLHQNSDVRMLTEAEVRAIKPLRYS